MSDKHSALPIAVLIRERRRELGLTSVELIRRSGYINVAKGLRRLERLCEGYWHGNDWLIQALPQAIQISPEALQTAIADTQRQFEEAEEAAYRAAFAPHAIIVTDRPVPHPIFVIALFGADRLIKIDLDLSAGALSFPKQAIEGIRRRLAEFGSSQLPAFGKPTGFIVNYTPDRAVQFDLDGNPTLIFDRSRRLGKAHFSLSGRELTENELSVFGMR